MGTSAAYQYERDTEFFTAIWESLCAEAGIDTSGNERRNSARFDFHTIQLAASANGDAMPAMPAFKTIRCHDISCGGFSYYSTEKPPTDKVILLLQTGGLRHCIEGRIIYSRPILRSGDLQFLVGCQFTRRVDF